MPRFYELLLRDGMSKSEALRRAQIDFIEGGAVEESAEPTNVEIPRPDYSHPYFWAPFVLMGNWL